MSLDVKQLQEAADYFKPAIREAVREVLREETARDIRELKSRVAVIERFKLRMLTGWSAVVFGVTLAGQWAWRKLTEDPG